MDKPPADFYPQSLVTIRLIVIVNLLYYFIPGSYIITNPSDTGCEFIVIALMIHFSLSQPFIDIRPEFPIDSAHKPDKSAGIIEQCLSQLYPHAFVERGQELRIDYLAQAGIFFKVI